MQRDERSIVMHELLGRAPVHGFARIARGLPNILVPAAIDVARSAYLELNLSLG